MNALPFALAATLAASLLFTLVPHGPAVAQAPVRQVVPYSGHLDQDGSPFDGSAALRFRVYAQPAEGDVLWTEIHPAVNVRDGRFAVRLGEQPLADGQDGIVELATAGDQLYLELSVADPAPEGVEPDWTQLAGRQALHPAPQALWAATGSDLRARSLSVEGAATVGSLAVAGEATMGSLNVAERASIGSQLAVRSVRVFENINNTEGPVVVADDLTVNGTLVAASLRREGFRQGDRRGGGDFDEPGPSANTHFCALAQVIARQNPPGPPECDAYVANGTWRLRAVNALCSMQCLRFR